MRVQARLKLHGRVSWGLGDSPLNSWKMHIYNVGILGMMSSLNFEPSTDAI